MGDSGYFYNNNHDGNTSLINREDNLINNYGMIGETNSNNQPYQPNQVYQNNQAYQNNFDFSELDLNRETYVITKEKLDEMSYVNGVKITDKSDVNFKSMIITYILIALNVLIYYITANEGDKLFKIGGARYDYLSKGHQYYRLISSIFLHQSFQHLYGNMIGLWAAGSVVEPKLGKLRTTIIYFASGIISVGASIIITHSLNPDRMVCTIGASGAVFGMIASSAFLIIKKNRKNRKSDLIKAIVVVVVYAVMSASAGVNWWAHVVGAVVGAGVMYILTRGNFEKFRETAVTIIVSIVFTIIMGIVALSISTSPMKPIPDERIDIVKETDISEYVPGSKIEFGELLEGVSNNPGWEAFKSEGKDYVNFEGEIYYKGRYEDVLIQFAYSEEYDLYYISYFQIDGKPRDYEFVANFIENIAKKYKK